MSNRIIYDPLLVRYLAGELDEELRGRACAAAPLFDSELGVLLPLAGGRALRLDLHPTRGWVRFVEHATTDAVLDSRCTGVAAPPDERSLAIHLASPDRFGATARRLIIELHTNQWNALLVSDEDDRILALLRSRSARGRVLEAGAPYEPPAGEARFGAAAVDEAAAWDRWRSRLEGLQGSARRAEVLRGFAYTGSPNVTPILGEAEDETGSEALRAAFDRWWLLRSLPTARPVLLRLDRGSLPYPLPLPGVTAEPIPSLLAGMSKVAEPLELDAGSEPPAERAALTTAAARRAAGLERRILRLQEELASAGEAERLRRWGDLLLAKLHEVPRGADQAELEDWEGGTATIPLDPKLSPAENAERLYQEARKRGRAEARLPGLIAEARKEAERWRAVAESPSESGLPAWALEVLARRTQNARGGVEAESDRRPYRVFRTSGGLEVRVGRSAKANDRLTFGHASPNDVWLHAQSVPGSHVVLRWTAADAPPGRDLEEAAVLAARYSRARTSTLVAVDWTRRKHVRKPRGAPPGSVVLQRARTVFVEPDPRVEERMRVE